MRYSYYRCVAATKRQDVKCPLKSIAGGLIEKEVIAYLGEALGSPEFIRLAANDAGWEESEVIDSRAFVWRELLTSGTYTDKTKHGRAELWYNWENIKGVR